MLVGKNSVQRPFFVKLLSVGIKTMSQSVTAKHPAHCNIHYVCFKVAIMCSYHFSIRYSCYRPQTKFAKVMFLHLSVSHPVHRGSCMEGQGVCMAGGMCGRGACMAGEACMVGVVCVMGGMHGRGGLCGEGGHA